MAQLVLYTRLNIQFKQCLICVFFKGRSKREPGSSGMNMSEIESQDTDTADPKHNESTNTEHEKKPLLQGLVRLSFEICNLKLNKSGSYCI